MVPVSKSSVEVVPPNGMSRWVWTSMPPGITYWPDGVDGPVGLVAMGRQVLADRRDGAVLAVDVGDVVVRGRDDAPVGDEKGHGAAILPQNRPQPRCPLTAVIKYAKTINLSNVEQPCQHAADADCVPGGAGRLQRGGGAGLRRRGHAGAVPELRGGLCRRWRRARPPAASCRWRTRSAAPSTGTTTCWSSTSCRSSARCELKVDHCLLALPGVAARGHQAWCTRTRRRWRSASGSCAAAERRDRSGLRHRRRRQADPRAAAARPRRDRLDPARPRCSSSTSCTRACRTSTTTSRASSSSRGSAITEGADKTSIVVRAAERARARCSAR